jgi:hypothetical protein
MHILLALLLLSTPPAEDQTSWMTLESFHLSIGMSREDALKAVAFWNPKQGKTPDEYIVDYKGDRAFTLGFRKERLHSVRFELYVLLPKAREAFDQARKWMMAERGAPKKQSKSVLVYDNALPNVMAVVTDDPQSESGKRGVGIVAIRYYDPRN